MLKGFNPWQKRIAILGVLGVVVAVVGLFGPWLPIITAGIAITLSCILVLVLLGNRQNWRQLKSLEREVSKGLARRNNKNATRTSEEALPVPQVGADFEYAQRIQTNRSALESFALRSKSIKIRDAFALAATAEKFKYRDLVRFIAVQRMGMLPSINKRHFQSWNIDALLALTRLQANQQATDADLQNAEKMFAFIQNFFGMKALKKNDRLIFLEVLGELGRYEQQAALARRMNIGRQLPVQTRLMELNHVRDSKGSDSDDWLQLLNELYERNGYDSVAMDTSAGKPLDRLSTSVKTYVDDGPRVSVIVPTFEGGPALLSALRSIIGQSWQNLEVIVVDDGSDRSYDDYLSQASALSPKITVVRQERNLGAYSARNRGLTLATGEYITVHDDDDWSHGNKIETQVTQLIDNPELPGNMSSHVRVTEDLKFTRINNNPILSQANFSSLMVHRSVFAKMGSWDTVNRGADSEFRDRVVKYYGQKIPVLNDLPMSFTRTWEGSLTSGEMSRGYVDPARLLYLSAYTQAHESVGDAVELLKPSNKRLYPVPSTMEPGARNKQLGSFDLVFMTDFRFPGGTTSLTLREVEIAARAGLRVGYIHAESPLNAPNTPVSSKLLDMQLRGTVEQISLQDSAQIRLLVIRHPSVVTFLDQASSNLAVARSVLIVNNPPVLRGGTGMVFDLTTAVDNTKRLFGVDNLVVAESGVTRALCEPLVPRSDLSDETWPGVVTVAPSPVFDFGKKPIVGRHSRDNTLKWPSTPDEFKAAYVSDYFDTKILGGAQELTNKHGREILDGLTVYEFGELEVQEFLRSVDFWVYFHDEKLTESFGMSIAEAMAAGKVVILPPYLKSSFGEGAVYAQPDEVESLVQKLWNNPESYMEQSRRAQTVVEDAFSPDSFLARVSRLSNCHVENEQG